MSGIARNGLNSVFICSNVGYKYRLTSSVPILVCITAKANMTS